MANLQLISVRIDPQTLKRVDELTFKHRYWKRNTIINGLLTAIVDAMDDGTLYDMVRYMRHYHPKPKGTFYIPEKLPINPAANPPDK